MTWLRVGFDGAITHCVHRDLLAPLVADMVARDHRISNFEEKYGRDHAEALGGNPLAITEWAFDLGGGCHVNAPLETIEIAGLNITLECDHLEPVLRTVEASKPRVFATGDWYIKLKFWHHATVLSPAHRDAVVAELKARRESASSRAAEFFAALEAKRSVQ